MNKETILRKINEELNKLATLNKDLESSYHKALEFMNEVNNNDLPASVNKLVMAHASIRGARPGLFVAEIYRARVNLTHTALYGIIKHYKEDIKLLQYFVEYLDTLEDC